MGNLGSLKSRILFRAVCAAVTLIAGVGAAHAAAYVRVNQVGYVSAASKRAYLMASATETGATFVVKNSGGSTVFGPAAIGANLGSWSSGFPDVYALDFDSFTTAGTYTISVSGPIAATSPSFKIDTAANVYTSALSNSLFFYQNERDGPNFVGTALRTAAAHLNDQSAKVYVTPNVNNNGRFSGDLVAATFNGSQPAINGEGGWWDAGDYMAKVFDPHLSIRRAGWARTQKSLILGKNSGFAVLYYCRTIAAGRLNGAMRPILASKRES